MTIQEAAREILQEAAKPMSSKALAERALERHMVTSTARDPVQSHAQTIEKNIRDGIYNNPKLVFVNGDRGRLIGLPEWGSGESSQRQSIVTKDTMPSLIELRARIPADLLKKIKLATLAEIKSNFDATVSHLLSIGYSSVESGVKKKLLGL